MTLNEVSWDGPTTLEDLVIWGVQPARGMLELLDEKSDFDADDHTRILHMEIKSRLEAIEETIYRFIDEAKGFEAKAT